MRDCTRHGLNPPTIATSAEYPYGKLHGLFRLPWFRRTWVVQEVALARKVMFYCGDYMIAFDNLVVAADFTRLPYSKLDMQARHWKSYLDWHHMLNEFIRRYEQGETDVTTTVGFGLFELLAATLLLEATRAEDKVYGLYGCAKTLGFELPVPDYTKPIAVVYTEAARACLRQAQNPLRLLEIVEGSAGEELGLPSWVPNLSGCVRKWTPENPPKTSTNSRSNKLVSGGSQSEWNLMVDERRLRVRGRRVDHVAAVGQPWKVDHSTTLLGDAWSNSGQYVGSLVDCILTWLDIVLQRNRSVQGSGAGEVAATQDLARLLTNGHRSLVEPLDRVTQYLSVLIKCAKADDTVVRSSLIHAQDSILEIRQIGHYFVSENMQRVITQMGDFAWRTVFRTTRGYLGVGSYSSRPGDLVVVLHGMATPCLVRPSAEGFVFVGAAFVNEIMNGEFWSTGSSSNDEWFVLV
ncbi:uncharacterized protein K460DRAFT_363509 [Cucurbitaria berberidis CBS 394.84]|uniref:Heterokaryon incompatibility domain-containing protein n=1 Tax=Cucurbitaria berberidis CBS 394.84 TaxID=1168544 RepID=A0A9P4GJK2_9PLEO|nr:uncharacterized protein K460DRAFT_363509 [Cucurbitaria berberidis CBS 394.84]KAF1847438.1 hypothetical protein K460DRAFT_363509 [Cucurbitaria berberidis CBS 394.84]